MSAQPVCINVCIERRMNTLQRRAAEEEDEDNEADGDDDEEGIGIRG